MTSISEIKLIRYILCRVIKLEERAEVKVKPWKNEVCVPVAIDLRWYKRSKM